MKEYLFSYGTLQKSNVQLNLFGHFLEGTKDILSGYKVSSIEITDAIFLAKVEGKFQHIAIATNDKNDRIEGTVFEVTGQELLHADKYEPVDYARIRVTLESGKEAWVYAAKSI
jgi:gamma-glutamylcyclotransferase (GGCT)/AIG2-like uncharacterized protein YtfP